MEVSAICPVFLTVFVAYRNSRLTLKKLEIKNQLSVTTKRRRSMDFSSRLRREITLLISQESCLVSKLEENGMLGRPRRE